MMYVNHISDGHIRVCPSSHGYTTTKRILALGVCAAYSLTLRAIQLPASRVLLNKPLSSGCPPTCSSNFVFNEVEPNTIPSCNLFMLFQNLRFMLLFSFSLC